ncbi:MAG: zinc metalloprotease [Myxococcota bacterium]
MVSHASLRRLAFLSLALAAACGDDGSDPEPDMGPDGGATLDTGGPDAAPDAGITDGGTGEAVLRIPVVVHVVHNGEAVGQGANISFEQVRSQIEVLNEDFRRQPGTLGFNDHPAGADTEIEFFLAPRGPDGTLLLEPGVDRVDGQRSVWPKGALRNPIDTMLKPPTIWTPERYFNIWTVNFGGFVSRDLLGYAQFPSESGLDGLNDDGGSAETDGIVVGYKYFGSREKGDFPDLTAPFDLGRTTTHEVGHWLGLRHIWGDGACGVDDFCSDTPAADSPNFGCAARISCGSADMVENYMDYTDDGCMSTFTVEQRARMRTVLEQSPRRRELVALP